MAPFLPPRPQNLSQAGHLLEFPAHYYHKFVYFQKFEGHFPSALTQHKLRETRSRPIPPAATQEEKLDKKYQTLPNFRFLSTHVYSGKFGSTS